MLLGGSVLQDASTAALLAMSGWAWKRFSKIASSRRTFFATSWIMCRRTRKSTGSSCTRWSWGVQSLGEESALDVDELGELCAAECLWLQVTDGSTFLSLLGHADAAGRNVIGSDGELYRFNIDTRHKLDQVGACLRQVL